MSLFSRIFGCKQRSSPVLEPIEPQAEAPFVPGWPLSDAHIEELLRKTYPSWLIIAEGELNVREIPGSTHNPRIVEYHQATSLKATTDEVPWCASFVNWCLLKAEQPRTRSAAARSFLDYGLQLDEPWLGRIAIFQRATARSRGTSAFTSARSSATSSSWAATSPTASR